LVSSDETVEVGAALYELDTEATATVVAETTEQQPTAAATVAAETPTTSIITETTTNAETQQQPHRIPSIHFLGKEGWANLKSGTTQSTSKNIEIAKAVPSSTTTTTTTTTTVKPSITGASTIIYDDVRVKHPLYGRPAFTEIEIEALLLGGASIAPQVTRHSTGAQFQH
jgi:hypothetical protein